MTDFFIYDTMPELLTDKLTRAEQQIYKAISKLSRAVNNSFVYATIDYLTQHTIYKSKSFISKTLKRLTDKGLILRELVQSNKSRHKCYLYYVVSDLKLTKLYQDLSEEEKKKYVAIVDTDKPINTLTDAENKLYCYLKYNCGIKDMTHKKLFILLDCARNNAAIVPGTEIETIMLMSKFCVAAKVFNKFGYLKKTIINYSIDTTASYTPTDRKMPEAMTADTEKLYNACIDMNVRLSAKQIKAIVKVSDKLKIDINRVINIISNVTHIRNIKDVFKYIMRSMYNSCDHGAEQSWKKQKQSYDISEFKKFSVTFSGNTGQILDFAKGEK